LISLAVTFSEAPAFLSRVDVFFLFSVDGFSPPFAQSVPQRAWGFGLLPYPSILMTWRPHSFPQYFEFHCPFLDRVPFPFPLPLLKVHAHSPPNGRGPSTFAAHCPAWRVLFTILPFPSPYGKRLDFFNGFFAFLCGAPFFGICAAAFFLCILAGPCESPLSMPKKRPSS